MKYTGYGILNPVLDQLEELKQLAIFRANDLFSDEMTRAKAEATASAYGYCQLLLINLKGES
jgi:hypothetical protein